MTKKTNTMTTKKSYVFFRKEGFYTIELINDCDAINNAKCNPGTYKVEDIHGKIIWKKNSIND